MKVAEALAEMIAHLVVAGVENPRPDARLLLAHVLGVAPQSLVLGEKRLLRPEQQATCAALVARRVRHEPVSRILGRRGFWTLDLYLNAETFDPRPDTETVIEAVLEQMENRQSPCTLLDLGTGSGCLLLALLTELPNATGLGVDIAAGAVAAAHANACAAGLATRARFRTGDWGRGLDDAFDVIVANPPYIVDSAIDTLAPEVARFDPRCALRGGSDGLAAYRALAPDLVRLLQPEGLVALEIGQGQAPAVEGIMAGVGLSLRACRSDLSAVVRCMLFHRAKMAESEKSSWK